MRVMQFMGAAIRRLICVNAPLNHNTAYLSINLMRFAMVPQQSCKLANPQTSAANTGVVRCHDASLLFRCMEMLQTNQAELVAEEPLLFRELQGICTLCLSKSQCADDLSSEFDDMRWDRWRAYCPNSAMLLALSAVQNCPRAAQHLGMREVAALSHLHP